jgi:hypothetical protein
MIFPRELDTSIFVVNITTSFKIGQKCYRKSTGNNSKEEK